MPEERERMAPPLRPEVLTSSGANAALVTALPKTASTFLAFYSSVLGGITTDPALFTIPVDDHMAHRGARR